MFGLFKKKQPVGRAFKQGELKPFEAKIALGWQGKTLTTVTIRMDAEDRTKCKHLIMSQLDFKISSLKEVNEPKVKSLKK